MTTSGIRRMNSQNPKNPENSADKLSEVAERKRAFAQVMDNVDLARAARLRNEYGRVRWLVSWYAQEDGFWLARLSCPKLEDTVEALGQSRCLAIDSATRHLLDLLHRQAAENTANDYE